MRHNRRAAVRHTAQQGPVLPFAGFCFWYGTIGLRSGGGLPKGCWQVYGNFLPYLERPDRPKRLRLCAAGGWNHSGSSRSGKPSISSHLLNRVQAERVADFGNIWLLSFFLFHKNHLRLFQQEAVSAVKNPPRSSLFKQPPKKSVTDLFYPKEAA